MHFVTEEEWRAHCAEVVGLNRSVIALASAFEALAPFIVGVKNMSAATTAALAKLDTLEAKVDKLLADKQADAAAALAADEADAVKIEDQTDRIGAKLDQLELVPAAATTASTAG